MDIWHQVNNTVMFIGVTVGRGDTIEILHSSMKFVVLNSFYVVNHMKPLQHSLCWADNTDSMVKITAPQYFLIIWLT